VRFALCVLRCSRGQKKNPCAARASKERSDAVLARSVATKQAEYPHPPHCGFILLIGSILSALLPPFIFFSWAIAMRTRGLVCRDSPADRRRRWASCLLRRFAPRNDSASLIGTAARRLFFFRLAWSDGGAFLPRRLAPRNDSASLIGTAARRLFFFSAGLVGRGGLPSSSVGSYQ
jgi:hypothetical protein